jgi:hypothetical protein
MLDSIASLSFSGVSSILEYGEVTFPKSSLLAVTGVRAPSTDSSSGAVVCEPTTDTYYVWVDIGLPLPTFGRLDTDRRIGRIRPPWLDALVWTWTLYIYFFNSVANWALLELSLYGVYKLKCNMVYIS